LNQSFIGDNSKDEVTTNILSGATGDIVAKLPERPRQVLKSLLETSEDETLLYIEQQMFWQASGSLLVVSFLGTIALLFVAIFAPRLSVSTYALLGCFPIAFVASVYGYFRMKQSFVAFTNKRVIMKPAFGAHSYVYFKDITAVTLELNYLYCRRELHIKRFIPKEGNPKVSYVEAIPNIEFYKQFLEERIVAKIGEEQVSEDVFQRQINLQ